MEKQMVKRLIGKKLEQCAENDAFLLHNTDTCEELDFYSDTERVMEELTYKYDFTEEEVFRFRRHYDIKLGQELLKYSNK